MGCLVLGQGNAITGVRWVPERGDIKWTVRPDGAAALQYTVASMSLPFVERALGSTAAGAELTVHCLSRGSNWVLHGPFTIENWQAPVLSIGRPPLPGGTDAVPHPRDARSALAGWCVDVGYEGVTFPIPGGDPYIPTGIIHNGLSEKVVDWCGPTNRLGSHCLLTIRSTCPEGRWRRRPRPSASTQAGTISQRLGRQRACTTTPWPSCLVRLRPLPAAWRTTAACRSFCSTRKQQKQCACTLSGVRASPGELSCATARSAMRPLCRKKNSWMDESRILVLAFAAGLLLLFVVHWLVTSRREGRLAQGGLLLTVVTQKRALTGVETVRRVRNPHHAQRLLASACEKEGKRGITYQEGTVWVVATGKGLAVQPKAPGSGGKDQLVAYYLRRGAPEIHPADKPNENDLLRAAGWVASPNSALSPAAAVDIRRFPSAQDALSNVNAEPGSYHILFNGPNDPAYYVARVEANGPNPVQTAPGLPGMVYSRVN